MRHPNYKCPKCGSLDFEQDQFRATGSYLAKMFDIQNKRFVTVSCMNCGYTEIYKKKSNSIGDVFDFFIGG